MDSSKDFGMTRCVRSVVFPLMVLAVVVLSGCGGASGSGTSEADRKICLAVADLPIRDISTMDWSQAPRVLEQLSGYAPNDERLVRAVERARDDTQTILDATSPFSYPRLEGGVSALRGSASAIRGVCEDLGA
jgi:hypothetical protein